MGGTRGLIELERGIDVAWLVHVDPQEGPGIRRPRGEREQMLEARLGIQLEAEVGEFDRDLGRQLAQPDLIEYAEILIAHFGRFVAARDLLAQVREHAAEPCLREAGRGVQRGGEVTPRHEAAY